jgi:hypothetical protein
VPQDGQAAPAAIRYRQEPLKAIRCKEALHVTDGSGSRKHEIWEVQEAVAPPSTARDYEWWRGFVHPVDPGRVKEHGVPSFKPRAEQGAVVPGGNGLVNGFDPVHSPSIPYTGRFRSGIPGDGRLPSNAGD